MADGDPLDITGGGMSTAAGAGLGVASLGVGLATANPLAVISGVTSLIGVGLSIFVSSEQSKIQQQEAQVSQQISGVEQQINAQRQQQMVISARRQQLQTIRSVQQARSQALAAGVNQGGQFGSGVAGGEAQASAQGAYNQLGVSNSLQIGQNIFGLTNQQDQLQAQLASLQGKSASYAGISSLGGDVSRAGPALTNIFGGFGFGANTGSQPSSNGGPTGYIV